MVRIAYNTGNQRIFECSECGYGIMDIYISNEEKYPIAPNYCPNCGAKIDHEELMKRYYDASIDFGKWMKEHTDVDGNIIIPNEELNR